MKRIIKHVWKIKWALGLWLLAGFVVNLPSHFYNPNTPAVAEIIFTEYPSLHAWLTGHPVWAVLGSSTIAFILSGLSLFPLKSAYCSGIPLQDDGLLAFLDVIERPVSAKLDRFCEIAKKLSATNGHPKGPEFGAKVFLEITQPESQIREIAQSIFLFFRALDQANTKLKVAIFYIKDKKVLDQPIAYAPSDSYPTTPIDKLNGPGTPIAKAIKTKKLVIVPDTSKTKQGINFYREPDDTRRGSMICYPVVIPHLREVRLAICVYAPESPGYFKDRTWAKQYYTFVFDKMQRRLILEHSLHMMRKRVERSMEAT
ncbi:hypothetical protein [Desulfocurvus sp. DL9XJH121]